MQLITEQFGGNAFHFQSNKQSSCCSLSKEDFAQRGTSFLYTSESFSSSAAFQPPCSSQRGDSSVLLQPCLLASRSSSLEHYRGQSRT